VTVLNGSKGLLLRPDYFDKVEPIEEQIKEVFRTKEAVEIKIPVLTEEELAEIEKLRKIEVNALAETQLKETVEKLKKRAEFEKLKKRAELEKQLAALD